MSERVTGIGGVFLKAKDPDRMAAWYRDMLGVDLSSSGAGGTAWTVFRWSEPGSTVWALFPDATGYFGAASQRAMVNFRVRDLDAMLAQLRAADVRIHDERHEDENGRFAWIDDPEGNRIELWQPASGK